MNRILLATLATLVLSCTALWASPETDGSNLGSVRGGDFTKVREILEKKCTPCHSSEKIDAALKSGKDMNMIQQKMENRGVQLSGDEREVLGIYWTRNPLKK